MPDRRSPCIVFCWSFEEILFSFYYVLLNSISLAFRILPGMETPLDVLSRAASLVHADDEKRKSQVELLF